MQTILGAGGAIGLELAKVLPKYTGEIRLAGRNPQKVNATDSLFVADLNKRDEVFGAVKGSEIVYLTAGLVYKTRVWQEQWPPIMQHVIDACIEYGARLVFFDNLYLIGGDNVKHITENSPISPTSKKGEVRAKLDRMLLDKIAAGKIHAIIARSADFYGIGANMMLMEVVYKNLAKNKKAQWLYTAKTKHSFTYTPDAGLATAMLGNSPDAYDQVWNLPTDPDILTGEEWISLFATEMGKSDKYQLMPAWMVKAVSLVVPLFAELYEMRYQFDRDFFLDSTKFEKHFNYTPTTYRQGVKAIVRQLQGM
ncbi:MAG: NAD-dependent epimerase/dehydratase family protein [Bacteroidetes bacterium]|nr:NAD-dependent epimerase/dehydratase family protein [Bacteroidota bacterium]